MHNYITYRNGCRCDECRISQAAKVREEYHLRKINNPDAHKKNEERNVLRKRMKKIKEAGRPIPDQCEICDEQTKLVFDHCHKEGHFRGWICNRCNRTLGFVQDNIDILIKMKEYLESR